MTVTKLRKLTELPSEERMPRLIELWRAGSLDSSLVQFGLKRYWQCDFQFDCETSELVRMFREARFFTQGKMGNWQLRDWTTVYRGSIAPAEKGMAWSVDATVAAWFGCTAIDRAKKNGRTLPEDVRAEFVKATVPASGVLALIAERDESEYVVDPSYVRNTEFWTLEDPVIIDMAGTYDAFLKKNIERARAGYARLDRELFPSFEF